MAKVERSSQAELDLIEIWLYIARDNLAAADKLLDQIDSICKMLARSPLLGRLREELAPRLRSFPVGDYLIFYLALCGRPHNARYVGISLMLASSAKRLI